MTVKKFKICLSISQLKKMIGMAKKDGESVYGKIVPDVSCDIFILETGKDKELLHWLGKDYRGD